MKAKTVILLVICGSLLLLVGVFAVFFARGGQVLYWVNSEAFASGLIDADGEVVREIAKLDFTFSSIPTLTVHFQNSCWDYALFYDKEKDKHFVEFGFITVTGKVLRAFPSGQEYYGISGEELQKQLACEIQSRIPEGSEFRTSDTRMDYLTYKFQEYPERFRQKNTHVPNGT